MATNEPEPIRRSDLPCIPPPEWEFHTWFPHPGGGGDMVRGQRQRGVQVRRRVSYGDWEPVRPDYWADESDGEEASAASDATARPWHTVLLDYLVEARAKAARNAANCRGEEVARFNEGSEVAYRIAIGRVLQVFYGAEAATDYMRDGTLPEAVAAPATPALDDSLREQYAEAVAQEVTSSKGLLGIIPRITKAVLAVRDRRMQQLAAGRETWKQKALEMEAERNRLADEVERLRAGGAA